MVDTVTPLPDPPARNAQSNAAFVTAMDAWFVAQQALATEYNVSIGQFNVAVQAAFTGTSTTSVSIGTGAKSFTIETGRSFIGGHAVLIASDADPSTDYMVGTITSYDPDTGALVADITGTGGSGTHTDWSISLAVSADLSGYALTANVPELARDAVGAALTAGTGLSVTADDGGNTIDLALTGGVQEIMIPASAIISRITGGPAVGASETTINKMQLQTLDFDQSTAEYAQIKFFMPKRWNLGSLSAKFYWTADATGDAVWKMQAAAFSNDDPLDSGFTASQSVTDGVTATGDLMISAATAALAVDGSPAAGDMVVVQFNRDAANGSDTLAVDAKLIGVLLSITTNAGDDS